MPKTVLIADGRPSRRRRLKTLVSGLGYRLVEAGDAAGALEDVPPSRRSGRVAGSGFPDRDVDVLVREIKRRFRDVEVLVLADEPWVIEDLKELAAGFLAKPLQRPFCWTCTSSGPASGPRRGAACGSCPARSPAGSRKR